MDSSFSLISCWYSCSSILLLLLVRFCHSSIQQQKKPSLRPCSEAAKNAFCNAGKRECLPYLYQYICATGCHNGGEGAAAATSLLLSDLHQKINLHLVGGPPAAAPVLGGLWRAEQGSSPATTTFAPSDPPTPQL